MAIASTCCFFSPFNLKTALITVEMDQSLPNQQQKGSIAAQERGIISGDNVQFGRLRRRTRLSQSESQSSGPEEEQPSSSVDARNSRRPHNPLQDQDPPFITVKSSGSAGHQNKKSRNRTSSETEQGGKGGSKGPSQRKRGHSETENRPRWDKYDACHSGHGREMCAVTTNCNNDFFMSVC